MKVIELISLLHDNVNIRLRDIENDNIVSWYDGKNNIDEQYNKCEIQKIYNDGNFIELLISKQRIIDLFIENKSYVVEYKLNDKYYLFIEALDEFGCAINGAFNIENGKYDFDEHYITDNILVELHNYNYSDSICEWCNCSRFDLYEAMERVEKIMQYAIKEYESKQVGE